MFSKCSWKEENGRERNRSIEFVGSYSQILDSLSNFTIELLDGVGLIDHLYFSFYF